MPIQLRHILASTVLATGLLLPVKAEANSFDRLLSVLGAVDSAETVNSPREGRRVTVGFGRRVDGTSVNPDWTLLVSERLDGHLTTIAAAPTSRATLAAVLREVIGNVRTRRSSTRESLGVSLRYSLMAHAREEGLAASPRYAYDMHSGTITLLDADAGEPRATVVDGHGLIERIATATTCDDPACVDRALAGGAPAAGPA